MKLFEQIERLRLIHKLIDNEKTGCPDYFARRLGVSKRQLYNIIDDLRLSGAPIRYDSSINSYRYEQDFILKIDIKMQLLTEDEKKSANGGYFLSQCNFISLTADNFALVI